MFLFGWGTKNKSWIISGSDKHLLATWSYFHIFWCPIGYGIRWHIIGDSRSKDTQITYDKVKEMFVDKTPQVNAWQKYGMLMVIGGLIFLSLLGL